MGGLGEIGEIGAHHGSLSKETRHRVEEGLRQGRYRAVVATASLELGIDIGAVDLVCQIGSPHSVGVAVQRFGRSGRGFGAMPKGRLFPTTSADLAECAALLDKVRGGELDRLQPVRNAAGCAEPAAGGRGGGGRRAPAGRPVRPVPPRLALPQPAPRRLRRRWWPCWARTLATAGGGVAPWCIRGRPLTAWPRARTPA